MLTLLLVVTVLFAHLTVGVRYARHQFALDKARYELIDGVGKKELLEEKKAEKANLNHSGPCNQNFRGLESRGCDCNSHWKFVRLEEEIGSLQSGSPVTPVPNYSLSVTWPVAIIGNYVKNVEPAYSPMERAEMLVKQIEAAEKRMGIGGE